MKALQPSELDIQRSFQKRLYYGAPECHWVAIPNAARRTQWASMQAKREGLKKGFPDGLVIWPGGGIAFMEFKADAGVVSIDQAEWHERLDRYGHRVAVCRSADQAMLFLANCGAPIREREA